MSPTSARASRLTAALRQWVAASSKAIVKRVPCRYRLFVTADNENPIALPQTWDLVSSAYADEVTPGFEAYAIDALDLVGVEAGARVVDVAAGPGTLALVAARRGLRVDALDFSPEMIEQLEKRAAGQGVQGVATHVGDGMNLPFADGTYDAGFSMFGLFMFSDRARGFTELLRVLRPGARAVVASWQPPDQAPLLAALFEVLVELMPDLPFGRSDGPLTDPKVFAEEMTAAGFASVEVTEVVHRGLSAMSTAAFVTSVERSCAPVALLAKNLGEDGWTPVRDGITRKLTERIGTGPHDAVMPAWFGSGTRS